MLRTGYDLEIETIICCHVYGVCLQTGVGSVIGFTDHLQIVTTSNYDAIANLYTLQITEAHATSSQSAFTSRFLVTDLNNGDSSASLFTSLPTG
jgi:hypothetical protein